MSTKRSLVIMSCLGTVVAVAALAASFYINLAGHPERAAGILENTNTIFTILNCCYITILAAVFFVLFKLELKFLHIVNFCYILLGVAFGIMGILLSMAAMISESTKRILGGVFGSVLILECKLIATTIVLSYRYIATVLRPVETELTSIVKRTHV
jgi:hypothetical protein